MLTFCIIGFIKGCFQAFEIADLYEAYVTSAGDKELLNILKSETMWRLKLMKIISVYISAVSGVSCEPGWTKVGSFFDSQPG